jgi:hypothetical protein
LELGLVGRGWCGGGGGGGLGGGVSLICAITPIDPYIRKPNTLGDMRHSLLYTFTKVVLEKRFKGKKETGDLL